MSFAADEVRVPRHVVHDGFSNPGLRRSSRDATMCGSAGAHASLRRFAEGYSFGTPSRLGAPPNIISDTSDNPLPAATEASPLMHGAPRADSTPVDDADARTALQPACADVEENAPRAVDGAKNAHCVWRDGEDFASRMRKASAQLPGGAANNMSGAEAFAGMAADKGGSRRRRGGGSGGGASLLFGEGAPRTSLPVRARIERRAVPKRMRVDALAVIMGEALVVSAPSCDASGTAAAGGGGGGKVGGRARRGEGGGSKVDTGSVRRDDVDDEVADELSFLVKRCDLEAESSHSQFMPYIT